jgi:hypothetical protein
MVCFRCKSPVIKTWYLKLRNYFIGLNKSSCFVKLYFIFVPKIHICLIGVPQEFKFRHMGSTDILILGTTGVDHGLSK